MTDYKVMQGDQYKGWIYKWTNYIKGYQRRWFVLQNGLLSYYRNQAEMAHTCRGTINLANAFIHTEDSCSFVISNGGTQSFHLKASSEVERVRWVTALELAKSKAVKMLESDEEEENLDNTEQPDKNELQNTLKTLGSKIGDLNTCNDLIAKHGAALQRALGELEVDQGAEELSQKIKSVHERATLFRITANAMINACSDYYELAENQGRRWQRMLQHEHGQRLRLEDMVEQLARQQNSLENKARKSMLIGKPSIDSKAADPSIASSDDEDFHDAVEEQQEEFIVTLKKSSHLKGHRRTGSGVSQVSLDSLGANLGRADESSESDIEDALNNEAFVIANKSPSNNKIANSAQDSLSLKSVDSNNSFASAKPAPAKKRRKVILEKPNHSLNLWSIMKNCIGRDLSKIPMPVNFNEPMSFLQRLTEDLAYSVCLDKAAKCEDTCEQLAYLAAFSVSSYSTTTTRIGKPFNPLLGETFECDRREDLGWRSFLEQVSHHPPTCAMYAEGKEWTFWQEFTITSKFRGQYLQIVPLGISHLKFKKTGHIFTWTKIVTTVHSIIVGRLWVDNHGEIDIQNNSNGDNCHIKFSQYSYFSRETPRKVTAVCTNKAGEAKYVLTGTWDDRLECAKVVNTSQNSKGKPVFETGPYKIFWKRRYPPNYFEKMYNFTELAVELNELEDGVAPTDSRLRPDQRAMENADWDLSNKEKLRLEEKQRATRKKREAEIEAAVAAGQEHPGYQSRWFRKEIDEVTGNPIHIFNSEYWECRAKQDWTRCPDIF